VHRRAADDGVFFLDDGTDSGYERRGLEDARVSLDRARVDLATASEGVTGAERVAADAARLAALQHTATVSGTPDALVMSVSTTAGAAVAAGARLVSWVDCRVMLVDVAVSDAALSLLHPGSPATVVLEGERRSRPATVLLTRGAAATLDLTDLAALAKGRRPGLGQVVATLDPAPEDVAACPVGRAAFVHFPDANVLAILRARLRW
jgi:hypothetical protein